MRKLVFFIIFLSFAGLSSFSQQYVVTHNGLRDSEHHEKTYLVIHCKGKKADELYASAIRFVSEHYKNPLSAIQKQIESEYLSFNTHKLRITSFQREMTTQIYNADYRTELLFADGEVIYEVTNLVMKNNELPAPLHFTQENLSSWFIFNKAGELRDEKAKNEIERHFKAEITLFKSYLFGIKADGDW